MGTHYKPQERTKMKESTLVLDKDEATAMPGSAAKLIREVKYKTRKRVSSEDKIRIV